MGYAYSVNLQPTTGADAIFRVKEFLVAQGNCIVQASGMGSNVALGPTVVWKNNIDTAGGTAATLTIAAGDENKVGKLYGFCHDKNGSGQVNVVSMTWCYETVTLPAGAGSVTTTAKWDFVSGFVLDSAATVAAAHLYVKCAANVVYDITTGLTGRRRDELTTAALMANGTCWFVLESLDTTYPYQMLFQRNSSNPSWNVWYCTKDLNGTTSGGGFNDNDVAGNAKYDVVPSCWDGTTGAAAGQHAIILGGAVTLFGADNTYMLHIIADTAAPYSWSFFTTIKTTGAAGGGIFVDALVAGSYSTDPDPRLIGSFSGGSGYPYTSTGLYSSTYYGPLGHLKKGLGVGTEFFGVIYGCYLQNNGGIVFPYIGAGAGTEPMNGKEVLIPVLYARSSTTATVWGWKGISSLHHWVGSNRGNNDTLSVATPTAMDYIYITSGLVLPWDGSTVPIW